MDTIKYDIGRVTGLFVGSTVTAVSVDIGDERSTITTDRGTLVMVHYEDRCESVQVDDVVGDINDLVGGVVVSFEEVEGDLPATDRYDVSHTWTFYNIRTTKGDVTIRWYGTSNGYYSESVDVEWHSL
jgi:hypothetical protein